MNNPLAAAVDPTTGTVFVTDKTNNRVLLFENQAIMAIARLAASPTNASSLSFQVRFDGPVSGLSTDYFSLTTTGTLSGASITGLSSANASIYTVTVDSGSGSGTLRLNLANATALTPANILPGVPYTGGEAYAIDRTPPAAPRIDTPQAGAFSAMLRPQIGGTAGAAEAGAELTVQEGQALVCTATANPDGSWNCTPGVDLSAGIHVFSVMQTDAAANESQPSQVSFTIYLRVFLPSIMR